MVRKLPSREVHDQVRDTLRSVRQRSSVSPRRFFWFFHYLTPATLRETVERALEQRLPSLASEMAFNAMLGLFPGILVMLTAIGLSPALRDTFDRLAMRLGELAPLEVFELINNFTNEISGSQNRGLFSVSIVFAIWASSAAISAAMRALDQIHQIPPKQRRPFWQAKLVSLALTLGTVLLLVTACGLVFVSDLVVRHLANQSGEAIAYWLLSGWRLLTWPLALWIVSSAFSLIYRYGPSRWWANKPITPGAMFAAGLWAMISAGFRLYVSHFGNYNKAYGAVGTVIVLLLWLQLSSLAVLLGDQLNVIVGEAMERSQLHKTRLRERRN